MAPYCENTAPHPSVLIRHPRPVIWHRQRLCCLKYSPIRFYSRKTKSKPVSKGKSHVRTVFGIPGVRVRLDPQAPHRLQPECRVSCAREERTACRLNTLTVPRLSRFGFVILINPPTACWQCSRTHPAIPQAFRFHPPHTTGPIGRD